MPQQRYLVHTYIWNAADFERVLADPWKHLPGEPCTKPERMTLEDVKALISHAARNPESYDALDFRDGPGIEIIRRPIAQPMTVHIQRILGITISELPVDVMRGGY
jgi:hypothetical protein